MRKTMGICVVVLAMVPALVAGATQGETTEQSYKDYFDEVSYSGNNGSLEWSGPWIEEGESDGPGAGAITVTGSGCSGKCLGIEGSLLSNASVRRAADLSGFLDAKLRFKFDREPFVLSTGVLYVEVRAHGSGWKGIAEYFLLDFDGSHSKSINISGYLADDFEIRFRLGQLIGGDVIRIDDVKITGSVPTPTTTTSSTTSTTTSSTTSTTAPAVTTTTTKPKRTTTTATAKDPTTTQDDPDVGSAPEKPSTTTTTSTTRPDPESPDDDETGTVIGPEDPPMIQPGLNPSTPSIPAGSGLRLSRVGLLADFRPGVTGAMTSDEIEVLGVSLQADYSLAAEAYEATRLWIAGLALLIAIVLVGGMDLRRARRIEPLLTERGLKRPIPDRGETESEG